MNIKDYRLWIFVSLFMLLLILFIYGTTVRIVLNGSSREVIEVGSTYHEKGVKVKVFFKEIKPKIKTKNKVNTQKLGEYKITYEVLYKKRKFTKTRTVEVIDTKAPTIELTGKDKVSVCKNQTYKEEGYKATDNYDVDITKKIKITEKKQYILYTVEDSSGNKTSKKRNIVYEDKTAPIITLKGDATMEIYVGDTFKDPGVDASDNCDGNITDKVKTEGVVDSTKTGTYKLEYKVKDKEGNEASLQRTVHVKTKPVNPDKTIYLTFDDGPSASITPGILKILKEENVKATFFVINHSSTLDYLIKQEYDEGHTVGLHSYTHNYASVYSSSEAYFKDLEQIQNKVQKITGVRSKIIRFPGGSSNTISRKYNSGLMTHLTKEVSNRGFQYFDWNVGSGDSGNARTSAEVYNNVIKNLHEKASIILMHDFEGNTKTLNALRDIIRYGKENGYRFESIKMDTFPVHHNVNN